jgi:hypothetical protein
MHTYIHTGVIAENRRLAQGASFIHAYKQTCMYAYRHTDIHTYIHTYIHTQVIAEERRLAQEASNANNRKKKEKRHARGKDK